MTTSSKSQPLTYQTAGVDINAGNELIERIKSTAKSTHQPGVLSGLGGFGALFELPSGYQQPVLVSGTDGVGTKLKLALELKQHQGIGIDLVAMCVNDLIVSGAKPLFFLDYYATGKLDVDVASEVIHSIAEGCRLSGASLVGGETAEMPGVYSGTDYDLAGFCVGIVEKANIIDGSAVSEGDALIGLSASGPHSNGYSLIRKILDHSNSSLTDRLEGKSLGEWLIEPTRIYVKTIQHLMQTTDIHAISHITGGGLLENLPRVLPKGAIAAIDGQSWQPNTIFHWLKQKGSINAEEMYRTFNCGVGLVIAVESSKASVTLKQLENLGENAFYMGSIETNTEDPNASAKVKINNEAF